MTEAKKKSRLRDVLEKIGLVLASILFFLLAAEFLARAFSDRSLRSRGSAVRSKSWVVWAS